MSTKRKAGTKLATPALKPSAKLPTKSTIDESRTAVAGADIVPDSQAGIIEISSDANSDEDFSDADDIFPKVNGDKDTAIAVVQQTQVNGNHMEPSPALNQPPPDEDVDIEDADAVDGEATSPSFGELLRGNDAIDVPALLQQPSAGKRAIQSTTTAIVPPSHQSLTTVLSQALRTDDTDLLESCLHTTDLATVRNTIETIDTALAGVLLNKLAARLHRRPGRAGSLMTWVRWTIVAHGGALASQPKVVQSLSDLQKVLAERAKGLNSLLALKGKLDLLEGQMEMRRKLQHRSRRALQNGEDDEDEDVVWVEGEKSGLNGISSDRIRPTEDDDEEDGFAANGVLGESSDEDDDEQADEEDSDNEEDQLDEDEVDHDDVDDSMGEDDDSDVEAAPPSKMQKVAGSFFKRR